MELKETFVSRQEIFHGRIVDLRVDTVRLPNGHLTTREVIDHPGGVAVVAIDEKRQRADREAVPLCVPDRARGDPRRQARAREDPPRRELSEETGASCETLTPRRDPRLPPAASRRYCTFTWPRA